MSRLARLACASTALTVFSLGGAYAADLRSSYPGTYESVMRYEEAPATGLGVEIGVEFGLTNIKGHEIVYDGDHTLSKLIWETDGIKTAGVTIAADGPFGLRAQLRGTIGLLDGDGHMEDYDWLAPYLPGVTNTDWTDQSVHPDTRLDHYVNLDARIGRRVLGTDHGGVDVTAGVRHTDVKWTAYGGDYVYTTHAFRDTTGSFVDGERGISYQQRFTAPYLGLEGYGRFGKFSGSAGVQLGLVAAGDGDDDHWARNPPLRFEDEYEGGAFVGLEAKGAFAVTNRIDLTGAVRHERYTLGQGKVTVSQPSTGARAIVPDAAGGDMHQTQVSLGAAYKF